MNPLITLAVCTYNHERYIKAALEGAFSQTYSPLEIVISDDCSQDNTFRIIQDHIQFYKGPHRIRVNRNCRNLGVSNHFNRIFEMSSGELILLASGDDISLPERVEQTCRCWLDSQKKVQAVFTQARIINAGSRPCGLVLDAVLPEMLSVEWMLEHYPVAYGNCLAISRRVLDDFGPLPEDVLQEDLILPVRAGLLGPLAYLEKPLVLYRQHQNNLWKVPGLDDLDTEQLFAHLKRHSKSRITIFRCWLQDLETAREILKAPKESFYKYEHLARQKLFEAQCEEKLLAPGLIARLSILLNAYRGGIGLRKLCEWAFIYNLPKVYLHYIAKSRKGYRERRLTETG